MYSFIAVAFAGGTINAEYVVVLAMESFFLPFSLPKLMVVDDEMIFKDFLLQMCKSLGVPVVTVAKENHLAVQNEIFHKYLNNVQQLHVADKPSLQEWRLGNKCVVYSWNASTVDNTYI